MKYSLFASSLWLSGAVLVEAQATTSAEVLSDIALPAGAEIQMVGSDMRHNGNEVSVAAFTAETSIDATFDYFRDHWHRLSEDQGPGSVENSADGYRIIATLRGSYSIVLQLDSSVPARSRGFLSVLHLQNDLTPMPAVESWMDLGFSVLSHTSSNGDGRTSFVTVLESPMAGEQASVILTDYLTSMNWRLVSNMPIDANRVFLFNRGERQLEAVISTSPAGTLTVVNEVKNEK